MQPQVSAEHVFAKLSGLPPERISEVEDFIDFLRSRDQDRALTQTAQRAAETVLERTWDNVEDTVYDTL